MKNRWTDILGIIFLIIFAYPAHAHARNGNYIATIAIIFFGLVILFLVLREFFCWYWKINERIAILKDIRSLLQDTSELQNSSKLQEKSKETSPEEIMVKSKEPIYWECSYCGQKNSEKITKCKNCGKSNVSKNELQEDNDVEDIDVIDLIDEVPKDREWKL